MKPAAFRYERPATIEEVCGLLAEFGQDAKILAGGQSLGPLLNLRLAVPEVVVDINHVADLDRIVEDGHAIRLSALVRQRTAERSALVARGAPVLVEALQWVGHIGVRNRGTVVGSIAHADPASEIPAVLALLEGWVTTCSAVGERTIHAADLFESYFTTAIRDDELATEVSIPVAAPGTGDAWIEFAPRHGDYALVGVCASVTVDDDGTCRAARLVCTGIDSVPVDASAHVGGLVGSGGGEKAFSDVAERVVRNHPPVGDPAEAVYRSRLVRALVPKALATAWQRALDPSRRPWTPN